MAVEFEVKAPKATKAAPERATAPQKGGNDPLALADELARMVLDDDVVVSDLWKQAKAYQAARKTTNGED